ncbi:MAG TPA: type II secretion system protein, partial [Longimicrobiales bacterium]|nr:type II secretion system protein [Longimicrobiales bacterium]
MMLRNDRQGFTLIELLIVVVIIGILAAIALPKFGETRERAYVSAMKSDLRNIQTSAEMYHTDNSYTYENMDPNDPDAGGVTASDGVTLQLNGNPDADGYAVQADHNGTDTVCYVYVGDSGASATSASN